MNRTWYLRLAFLAVPLMALTVRMLVAQNARFVFLAWNLFLAALPLLLSLAAMRLRRRWLLWPLGVGWLLLLPNAPYLLTDFVHLLPRNDAPLWLDVLLLLCFAQAGLFLGVDSLHLMARAMNAQLPPRAASALAAACWLLCAPALFVGRFLRWNSWDPIVRPQHVFGSVTQLADNPDFWAFSFGFGLLLALVLWASVNQPLPRALRLRA